MLKIYASKLEEARLIALLVEFKARVYTSYPIKGVTRKMHKAKLYKVINYPI